MRAWQSFYYGEIRVFHSLNSGINVLANRQGLRNAGFDDWEIDAMAVACVAHSKSNSGVRNLNSRADWMDCFLRLDSAVAAWADDHPDDPITFDGSYLAADDAKLSMLASMTLALRAGDVSRDSGPDAEVQTGERVHVERDTLKEIPHNTAAHLAVPFPTSAACRFLDLPPVNLRNLQLHLSKNSLAS